MSNHTSRVKMKAKKKSRSSEPYYPLYCAPLDTIMMVRKKHMDTVKRALETMLGQRRARLCLNELMLLGKNKTVLVKLSDEYAKKDYAWKDISSAEINLTDKEHDLHRVLKTSGFVETSTLRGMVLNNTPKERDQNNGKLNSRKAERKKQLATYDKPSVLIKYVGLFKSVLTIPLILSLILLAYSVSITIGTAYDAHRYNAFNTMDNGYHKGSQLSVPSNNNSSSTQWIRSLSDKMINSLYEGSPYSAHRIYDLPDDKFMVNGQPISKAYENFSVTSYITLEMVASVFIVSLRDLPVNSVNEYFQDVISWLPELISGTLDSISLNKIVTSITDGMRGNLPSKVVALGKELNEYKTFVNSIVSTYLDRDDGTKINVVQKLLEDQIYTAIMYIGTTALHYKSGRISKKSIISIAIATLVFQRYVIFPAINTVAFNYLYARNPSYYSSPDDSPQQWNLEEFGKRMYTIQLMQRSFRIATTVISARQVIYDNFPKNTKRGHKYVLSLVWYIFNNLDQLGTIIYNNNEIISEPYEVGVRLMNRKRSKRFASTLFDMFNSELNN